MTDCFCSASYILVIKTMKNVVKILEEMFAEKQAKNSRPFFAVRARSSY
jgi:hypothetical protein